MTATAAQINLIRKLQADNAYIATLTVDWDAEHRSEANGYAFARQNLSIQSAEDAAWLTSSAPKREDYSDITEFRAANRANAERWADRRIAARQAGRSEYVAALTADPETLTKEQASSMIDLLKGNR